MRLSDFNRMVFIDLLSFTANLKFVFPLGGITQEHAMI